MERKGSVYHFKKEGPTLPSTIGTEGGVSGSNASEVLQVTPLRYISAEAAVNVLTPLLQPNGRILSLPSLNVIGIIASPDRVERVNQLLKIVDADPFLHRGMRLFRLQNSKAGEVQADLDKIMQAMAGGTPSAYQVLSLERINGLLVIAPPNSGFKEVEMWVKILDERSEESTEQVFIYNVRNLDAKELASTLSSVFESEREEDQVTQQNEAQNQNEQPSSRLFQTDDGITIVETTPEQTNQPSGSPTAVSAKLTVKIIADEKTNSLIVRATPRDYRQLLETIRILDRAPKEVMVNVVIAEVTLDETTQYGIDWQGILGNARGTIGFNAGTPGGNLPADVSTSTEGESSSTVSVGGLTGFTLNYISGGLTALLNLIDQNSDVRVLSRPSVLVRNNEEARIEVGSREPIPGASNVSAGGQIVNSAPQYESVGVILSVEPRINDDGIINLKISQEISSLGPTRNGNPSFDQRKVETLVVVRNGTPIVIGGLIQDRYNNSRDGITGLQRIPLLGDTLFASTTKNYQRTELVLMMVPEIVNPEIDNSPIVQQFKARMEAIGDMLNRETFHLYSLDRLRMVTEEPLPMP
jgi:general secretion pathway protein D